MRFGVGGAGGEAALAPVEALCPSSSISGDADVVGSVVVVVVVLVDGTAGRGLSLDDDPGDVRDDNAPEILGTSLDGDPMGLCAPEPFGCGDGLPNVLRALSVAR